MGQKWANQFVIGHVNNIHLPSRGNSGLMDNDGMTNSPVADVPAEAPAQKMLTVEQVNEIVKREKAAAADRVRQEMQAQMMQQTPPVAAPEGNSPGNMDQIYQEVYGRLAKQVEEHQAEQARLAQETQAQELANKYYVSMGKGKELFNDFDEIMSDFEPAAFPKTVMLAAQFEGLTPQIMYELAKNPQKLADIDTLASRSPAMAKKMLQGLADSIKNNEAAKQEHVSAPAPLNRLKSSMAGADTGAMTLRDLKKNKNLRG